MASQNVLQLTQQSGSADTSSVLYAVKGGNTDTGLPLSVLFTSSHLITPIVTGGSYSGGTFSNAQIASPTIAGGSADNISIGGLTPGPASFTTLTASGGVSGAGFTTLLAPYGLLSGTLAQFANTTSAQLASKITDETGTGVLVFGTSPTITTPNIVGTNTNNNAAAGSVGEYVTTTAVGVALTSGTPTNVLSISLTAGDWDVQGDVRFFPAATTTATSFVSSWSTTSATHGSIGQVAALATNFLTGASPMWDGLTPNGRLSISTTTTVFLVATATFGTSTMACNGWIKARRVR